MDNDAMPMLAIHKTRKTAKERNRDRAHGLLNLDHQPPAALRHSRRGDDKSADNHKNTSEDPSLSETCCVEDLAGDRCTDEQADGDDCCTTLATVPMQIVIDKGVD